MIHSEIAHSPTCAHRPQETCLTLGTIIRCCTISVWQMEAILVKTSSLAESLHTRFNRVLVCCFVSSFLRHSSVMYGAETLPSSYIQQRVNLSEWSAAATRLTSSPITLHLSGENTKPYLTISHIPLPPSTVSNILPEAI